jgi:plasmid stabilization system protein ParE
MIYEVRITEQAEAEAELAYQWIAKEAPEAAIAWFNGLVEVVESLESLPERCPLAPESLEVKRDIRQLLYGKFRILYFIHDDSVFVIHIRHGAQKQMNSEEL